MTTDKHIKNRINISLILLLALCRPDGLRAQTGESAAAVQGSAPAAGLLQEKLFMHTDKSFYVAGEPLWFKLYYMESASHKLLDISKIAYVEVLDKTNKPQLQAKIALEKGEGMGSFILPISLRSGSYTIRAYTNWMKNFGAAAFFEKGVTVVNTLQRMEPPPAEAPLYQLDFFPEGGQLVAGLQSKVAFKLVDRSLRGVDGNGLVIDNGRDTVCRFRSHKFGMGSFMLTPLPGHSYKAFVSFGSNQTVTQALPAALEQGWVMQLQTLPGQQLSITVKAKGTGRASESLYLAASNRQKVMLAQQATPAGDSAVFRFREKDLAEGITQFTLFNGAHQPLCERLYFRRPQPGMTITAKSDAARYQTRKRVNISLLTTDSAARPLPASLSMSVYLLDSLQSPDEVDVENWTWLGSELKGFIESPRYYFSHDDPQAAEDLMLTHGWRKFRQAGAGSTGFQYAPEYAGHIISGKVVHAGSGKAGADVQTFLSIPGAQTKFWVQKSGDSGQVRFDVKDYYGAGEIVVQTHEQDNTPYRVDIASPFLEEYTSTPLPLLYLDAKELGRLNSRSIGMQVQHAYTEDSLANFRLPQIDTLPFFGQPDHQYLLDNYTRFVTMEEVLREYVREINVRNRGGVLEMIMLDEPHREFFNGNMLVLFDGVPVFDQSKIFSYDPLKVKKLDVVSTQYFLGYYAFNGIASFSTYKGELEGFQLDPKAVVIDYEGLQLQREFYSPRYPTEGAGADRMPDFRSVLQWSPGIRINQTGRAELSFYTSDVKGKYGVVVQGVSADGKPGSHYFPIEVE